MRYALKLHPNFRCDALRGIEVDALRTAPDRLLLQYHLFGDIAELELPEPRAPGRSDLLWEHTCLEAFLSTGERPSYYEFNFAPSTRWAAYRLERYRSGMTIEAADPQVDVQASAAALELRASIPLPPDAGPMLGLCAVIKEKEGRKSYWALAHPPGEPDFHHKDCFAAQLPEMG